MVMSRNASMTDDVGLLRPMVPPALPRNAFFSERDFASKIGNSTHAPRVVMPIGGPSSGTGAGGGVLVLIDRELWDIVTPNRRCLVPVSPQRRTASGPNRGP